VPAIEDPKTGFKLWESGAIIDYLLDTYDKDHSLSYTSGAEKYQTKCWMEFQMSGQGELMPRPSVQRLHTDEDL